MSLIISLSSVKSEDVMLRIIGLLFPASRSASTHEIYCERGCGEYPYELTDDIVLEENATYIVIL